MCLGRPAQAKVVPRALWGTDALPAAHSELGSARCSTRTTCAFKCLNALASTSMLTEHCSGTEGVEEGGTGGCGREHEQGGAAAGQGGGWRGGHRQRYIGLSGGGRQKQDKQAPTSAAISNLTADPGCITPCSRREIYNCFSIEGGPRPLSLIQAE